MSRVIELQGTLVERMNAQQAAIRGLRSLGGSTGVAFFARADQRKGGYSWDASDVIVVKGEHQFYKMTPEEPGVGSWTPMGRECLLPKHIVVLERPDTLLYYLQRMLPKYNAEAGMIKAILGRLITLCGTLVALVAAFLSGYGEWSIFVALLVGLVLFLLFIRRWEYWIRAFLAALRGAFFVWRRVLVQKRSRIEYRRLIEFLARSYDRDVRSVNRILQYLI